jgi:hypothetical protein
MGYSNPIKHYSYSGATPASIMAAFNTGLTGAEWTSLGESAFITGTFTGQPANTQTVTINGQVYTFLTVPIGGTDVGIGATSTDTCTNLKNAVNANSTTATATNPTGTTILLKSNGTGSGTTLTASDTASNFSWSTGSLVGGYKLTTRVTDQFVGISLRLEDAGTYVAATVMSIDEVIKQPTPFRLRVQAETRRFIAWPEGVYHYLPTSSATSAVYLLVCTGEVDVNDAPVQVTNAQNNGGLVRITTGTAHGRTTGQQVWVSGVIGVPGANGGYAGTVVSPTQIDLDLSTFSGSYVSGGALAGPGQVSTIGLANGDVGGFSDAHLRRCIRTAQGGTQAAQFFWVNGDSNQSDMTPGTGRLTVEGLAAKIQHRAGHFPLSPSWAWYNPVDPNTDGFLQFVINNSGVTTTKLVLSENNADQVEPSPDGDGTWGWWNGTDPDASINSGANEGSILFRVPASGSPLIATVTPI